MVAFACTCGRIAFIISKPQYIQYSTCVLVQVLVPSLLHSSSITIPVPVVFDIYFPLHLVWSVKLYCAIGIIIDFPSSNDSNNDVIIDNKIIGSVLVHLHNPSNVNTSVIISFALVHLHNPSNVYGFVSSHPHNLWL